MKERLQKVLARSGVASRRAAEKLILDGRVKVGGMTVTRLGTQADAGRDVIEVDGKRLAPPPRFHTYLLLNKPRGYVTTLRDPEGRPTVRDLLAEVGARVYPVGRLDFQSEGLLILTDDGQLARDLMKPASGVPKTYLAKVRGRPDRESLARLARGLLVAGRPTLPARARTFRSADNSWVEVTVVEGRKHQVRKMLEAIGHPVIRLRRIRYAGIEMGKLPAGRFRPLAAEEIARLRRAVRPPVRTSLSPARERT